MGSSVRLGPANLALVSAYLAPVWGTEAFRALLSPFGGIDVSAHAAAANVIRQVFDFGLDGLMRTSSILATAKLVIAAGCMAYLIEFARAIVVGREPDRATIDVVLLMALAVVVIWSLPVLVLDDGLFVRLQVTQLLLVTGAAMLIVVERRIEQGVARTAVADDAAAVRPGAELSPRMHSASESPAPRY